MLMDKLEKLPLDALQNEMREIGLERAVVEDLLASLQVVIYACEMLVESN